MGAKSHHLMKINTYYLIKPKASLRQLTSNMDELSSGVLSGGKLWESSEGGRSSWIPKEYAARAKFAFLIHLKTEYQGAPGIDFVLSTRISEGLFDLHWDIEPLELAGNVNETSATLLHREDIDFPENAILREWLNSRVASD